MEVGFRSGKPNSDWYQQSFLMTECIWWKLQVHAVSEPSEFNHGVNTLKLSSKKVYTVVVNFTLTNIPSVK